MKKFFSTAAPFVGAAIGFYLGKKVKKPLIGAGAGFVIGSFGTMRTVQGPAPGKKMGGGKKVFDWDGYGSSAVASTKAATQDELRRLFAKAIQDGGSETGGKRLSGGDINVRLGRIPQVSMQIEGRSRTVPNPSQVAPLFGELKRILQREGANRTAQAFTQAASWYYYNVELPFQGRSPTGASSQSALPSLPTAEVPSLFGRGGKMGTGGKVALALGGLALIGGLAYFALSAPQKTVA